MKLRVVRLLPLSLAAGLLLAGAGCATGVTPAAQTQTRIAEKREAFNNLTKRQQDNILGGAIERGNTSDMVYMALGKPSKIVTSADGEKAMWVYVEFYSHSAPMTSGLNNPNSTHYTAMVFGDNAGGPGKGPPSSNAPGHFEGPPAAMRVAEFGGTYNIQPMQSLDLPDMKRNTVYVFYFRGKVVEIKLDGESIESASADPRAGKKSKLPSHRYRA